MSQDILPIFPLGDMVIFPGVSQEFYIFEPRYIQMIEHCLDSKGHFCFATLTGNWQELYYETPKLSKYGCVCNIKEYKKHEDGRYSILVHALHKTEIRELPSEQLYRQTHTKPIDYIDDITENAEESTLIRNFIKRFLLKQIQNASDHSIENIINDMEIGKFLSILCFQSKLSIEQKLNLLEESSLKNIFIQIKQVLDES